MTKYSDAVEKIFSLRRLGMKLGLENVKKFLAEIGNPQLELKTFHVAGSNGKGSTTAFLASVLSEAGFKVGMFTSPHFVDFTERIKINGREIEKEFVTKFVEEHLDAIEQKRITFFEITAAMAFEYFYREKVDYAVIETGLGGRLDATNTMNPLAEIITTISLEHTRILGDSVEKIAREKAGIIKENSKVYAGVMPREAKIEIEKIARKKNAEFYALEKTAAVSESFVKLRFPDGKEFAIYRTGFPGAHQLRNAALAVYALKETLGFNDFDTINKGLVNVRENTGLEGRFEIFSEKPLLILDAAHNSEGVAAFLDEFENRFPKNCKKKILIYGALRDKNTEEILRMFENRFDKILLTTIDFYRALPAEELLEHARKIGLKNARVIENRDEFISDFLKNESEDCLVILGSIYLLGEVKSINLSENK